MSKRLHRVRRSLFPSIFPLSIVAISSLLFPLSSFAASICFDNDNGYFDPYIYLWAPAPAGAVPGFDWPGQPMTAHSSGNYCFETASTVNAINVIFSDNGNPQTADLTMTSPNSCFNNGTWTTLKGCGINAAPVADAGSDITINQGEAAVFNGSASRDPDGSIASYSWSNGLSGVAPSLVYNTPGTYSVTLTVTDDSGTQSTDTVNVTVNAVIVQTISATSICFNNPNNYASPTIYMWDANPAGVQANFDWPGQSMSEVGAFYCYDPGVQLTSSNVIFNDNGNPQTADLAFVSPNRCYENNAWKTLSACGFSVEAINLAPLANAGSDITIEEGSTAYFDASASSDPDGSLVSYAWSNGLTGETASQPYTTPGAYTVTLTVTDNDGATATDTVVVTVTAAVSYLYPEGKAVFFVNSMGWNPPSAYIWEAVPAGSVAESGWPGVPMTDFGGLDLWFVDIGDNTTSGNIIFSNNGNNQSGDLHFSGDNLCYNNGEWMTLEACGVPTEARADAGPDRKANLNSRLALSAAASLGAIDGARWTSSAWAGELAGASAVTPVLTDIGVHTVTMTLPDGSADSFQLEVVRATQGLPERPLLAAPLGFPIAGSVSSGNYDFEPAFPNLDGMFVSPVMVTHDGVNDLIYVVDKPGIVSVFPNDAAVTAGEVVQLLDIRAQVRDYHEQGLLSIAFHPEFISNRYAYIYYVTGTNDNESDNGAFGDTVLERITLNSATNPTAVTARVEVLRIAQPGPDHKGGMMQFHPATGEFYMSIGDGAYGDTAITPTNPDPRTNNSSQETNNLRGTFIRLVMLDTPNSQGKYYDVPTDNPFVGDAAVMDEIWSYGHRNPWRWAFDSVSPYTLWETEVGQAGYEEVNIIEAGQNYGWPICEGTNHRGSNGGDPGFIRSCTNDLTGPVGGYAHNTGSVSIIGGFVYRGNSLPGLYGRFIYGDYVSKKVFSMVEGEASGLVSDGFPANISSFGTDVSGEEVFVSSHGVEYGSPSSIYRLIDRDAAAAVIPATLSETGLFADLAARIPAHGVIEYDVNVDGWFDGAKARHFVAVPNDLTIGFDSAEAWDLPVGSVLVKHLELPTGATTSVPFETSVLFRQSGGNWAAANYRWNAEGTDATLVVTPADEEVNQYLNGSATEVTRTVLSGAECSSCHTGEGSKNPLGFDTRQVNKTFSYPGLSDNQVDVFTAIDLFSQGVSAADSYQAFVDPEDVSADINERARAYLNTNCAQCHGGTFMDLNYDTAMGEMDIMNVERSAGVFRMLPFDHTASLLHTYQTNDTNRMPKGTRITNPVADQLFADWIDGLGAVQTGVAVKSSSDELALGGTAVLSVLDLFDNGFEVAAGSAVSWSSSNASVISLSSGSGRTVTVTAVAQGQATITASSGGYTGSVSLAVGGGPTQPSAFAARGISTSAVNLSWNDNASDETAYILRRSSNANGPFSDVATLAANAESAVDNGLQASTRYYYQLVARNLEGTSLAVSANAQTQDPGEVDAVQIIGGDDIRLIGGERYQLVAVATTGDESSGVSYSVTWSSSNDAVASVSSSGLVTGGATAGSAEITASYEGVTASVAVTSVGNGQYVYVNKPTGWGNPTAYIWTNENGVETARAGAWPGAPVNQIATQYGGTWLRLTIPATWANSAGDTNIIFSNNGATQTEDMSVNQRAPSWYDDGWLTAAPMGSGVETGTQVQVGNGEASLSGSTNLSGKLFAPGTLLNVQAHPAGRGMAFVRWEGTGSAYLLDANSSATQMVVSAGLSFTLLAVFDSVSDEHAVGRDYYQNQTCAGCHGSDGMGSPSLVNVPSNYTLASLTSYIEEFMPQGNAAACSGECASTVAAMIMDNAYLAPTGVCDASSLEDLIPQDRGFRMLSTLEYNNTIRDLFGLNSDVDVTTGRIPADIPVNGFKTNANAVFNNDYAKGYILAAEAAAALVSNIYSLTPSCSNISCFVQNFGKRAYRRPLTTSEVNDLVALHDDEGDLGLLSAMLSSPLMLYRSEVGEAVGSGYYQLNDYEVASLLSYTYWATTPDASLMAAADAGELSTPAQISARVEQMLQDPRAEVAFERFITGWLDLDKEIKTNALSASLKEDLKGETIEFVRRTVFGGGSYDELLTADYSYMTQQLASHYGLTWPGGSGWQRVDYTGANNAERRGILGHAGILALQSASEKTHPVKRGLFVRRSLMCQDFPPPPLGAALKPQEDPALTVRERFELAHLQDGCEACHQYIDGIGFGLENYNALGLYVTTETTDDGQVKPINALGYIGSLNSAETYLSESEAVVDYHGMDELAGLIAGSTNGKACYARQWYRYARGQREEVEDSCTLQVFGEAFKSSSNASMLDLMVQFTQTQNYILRK